MIVTEAPITLTEAPLTTVVKRDTETDTSSLERPDLERKVGGLSRNDVLNCTGAIASAICTTFLLFGRLTPLSGPFGFVLVAFLIFLLSYVFLTSLTESRPVIIDKVMTVTFYAAMTFSGAGLISVITFTFWRARSALLKTNLYLEDMRSTSPIDPLNVGGIAHAILGTLLIISIAIVITVPLGLWCAVYLNEAQTRLSRFVRTVVDAMTALPSILIGLFVFATWILIFGFERSALAASISVSILMLPIIIRSSEVVLRLVPGNLREASEALGAPRWRTVWHVVLPTARSGLMTSVLLGIARGVGETAPVMLTSGFTASINMDPIKNPTVSLPLATYQFVRTAQPTYVARGFATAAVLMIMVLVLFAMARFFGGRAPGQTTKRQARHSRNRSARDLARFETRKKNEQEPADAL